MGNCWSGPSTEDHRENNGEEEYKLASEEKGKKSGQLSAVKRAIVTKASNLSEKLDSRSLSNSAAAIKHSLRPVSATFDQLLGHREKDANIIEEQTLLPFKVLRQIARSNDLETFLALRATCRDLYHSLTPELWEHIHIDLKVTATKPTKKSSKESADDSQVLAALYNTEKGWPLLRRIAQPYRFVKVGAFEFENQTRKWFVKLDIDRLKLLCDSLNHGQLSLAMRSIKAMSIFLVPQTTLSDDLEYVQQLQKYKPSHVAKTYAANPQMFGDLMLLRILPAHLVSLNRIDLVLRGLHVFSDRVIDSVLTAYPGAARHLWLKDLTGLYFGELQAPAIRSLTVTVSPTMWSSIERTFKSQAPYLPPTLEYFELNREYIRVEGNMTEMAITEERMRTFVSKCKQLKTLKINTYHELECFDWVPSTVEELAIEDGDDDPRFITRSPTRLPNVRRFTTVTPYGAIFRKIQFSNLEHLQVGDLDKCECLSPVLASNPKLSSLVVDESEGTGPIWNVVLRNSTALETLVIEGEPSVFLSAANPEHLTLEGLRFLSISVLAESEQVEPILAEVLSRTPLLQTLYLRCEQLQRKNWGDIVGHIFKEVRSRGPNERESIYRNDDNYSEESVPTQGSLLTYEVDIGLCRHTLGL
ncbi:hypothetical protein TRVA0_070S00122 [Trichomonascus vanleenenianus]|uniref:uncharacterized protein n=1 Tax=Trichomonascus vanleenenianus TaxID=2268995 RepID=UPI003ECAE00E